MTTIHLVVLLLLSCVSLLPALTAFRDAATTAHPTTFLDPSLQQMAAPDLIGTSSGPGHVAFLESQRSILQQITAPDLLLGLEADYVRQALMSSPTFTTSLNAIAAKCKVAKPNFDVRFNGIGLLFTANGTYDLQGAIFGAQFSGYTWPSIAGNVLRIHPQLTNITTFSQEKKSDSHSGVLRWIVDSTVGGALPAIVNAAFSAFLGGINAVLPVFEHTIDLSSLIPMNKSFVLKPSEHVSTINVIVPTITLGPAAIHIDRHSIQVLAQIQIEGEATNVVSSAPSRSLNFSEVVISAFGTSPAFPEHQVAIRVSNSFLQRCLNASVKVNAVQP